jgi:hypothetical protein
MNLKLIKHKIIFILLIFLLTQKVLANFEITEIMYDLEGSDAGREWLEVKNIGDQPLDLSKWFFFSDNTKHSLKAINSSIVNAGEYAVICQNDLNFMKDWPNYNGLLFDSSWTDFSNKEETIALKNPELESISQVSFFSEMGAKGNSFSLQKINNLWVESKPTPGLENKITKKVETKTIEKKPAMVFSSSQEDLFQKEVQENEIKKEEKPIINLNEIKKEEKDFKEKIFDILYSWVGLVFVVLVGLIIIFLFKREKKDDLDEIEKEIRAEDIKIIE